ncbi:hypothetical protein QE152_g24697 [Popillia japonica]|uniref:Uncharacterized protein n=1 Tax=Popillia japonica TaxID=7064 RepID=A0AAW1K2V9_POPJA
MRRIGEFTTVHIAMKCCCYRRGLTLQGTFELAYIEDIDDIFIEPPDTAKLTDDSDGSGDEDSGGLVDNLSGAKLRVPVEIKLNNSERIGGCSEDVVNNATVLASEEKNGGGFYSFGFWAHVCRMLGNCIRSREAILHN